KGQLHVDQYITDLFEIFHPEWTNRSPFFQGGIFKGKINLSRSNIAPADEAGGASGGSNTSRSYTSFPIFIPIAEPSILLSSNSFEEGPRIRWSRSRLSAYSAVRKTLPASFF